MKCKWEQDEVCVNADCPMCADFCPVIDNRIDNNMGYSPNNSRWATPKQQANNRRDNVKIEYQGEKRTIAEWADRFGFNYPRFYQALKRGYTIDRYIEKEAHNRGNLHT